MEVQAPLFMAFYNPQGIAFDGAGTVWVASQGETGSGPNLIPPSILPIAPSLLGNPNSVPNYLSSASLGAGPLRVAVDGSGNVWVLLANSTVDGVCRRGGSRRDTACPRSA